LPWQRNSIATDFYELEPTPGPREKHKTEVRVLRRCRALHWGGDKRCVARIPILHQLSERDDFAQHRLVRHFIDTHTSTATSFGELGGCSSIRFSPTNGEDKITWCGIAHRDARHRLRLSCGFFGHPLQRGGRAGMGPSTMAAVQLAPEVF
jgi:hypothetical protein